MVNTMKKLSCKFFFITVVALLLGACSSMYDKHVQWERIKPESFPVLSSIGFAPISLQKSDHETQRMLMAIKASKIAAYAELAEQVYGQQVNGTTTMADLLIENQYLTASVRGVIRGAKVIKSYPIGDTYATELQLDFKDVYDMYVIEMKDKQIKEITYY